jgi:hemolysin D
MGFRQRAGADLLGRYVAVFRHAWRERRRFDPPPRAPHEAQFLPAALALQETPPSPAPRAAMWLLLAFAALAVLWSVFGRLDQVATAQGQIVPGDRSKVVQSLERALVQAIHVADGQTVAAGQVLLELDATAAQADRARIAGDLATARLQAARAAALLAAIDGDRPPAALRLDAVPPGRLAQEQRLLQGQYDEYRSRRARIEAEVDRRQAELASTRQVVLKLEQTAPLARRRAEDYKGLVEKRFVSEHGFLEKEQLRIEQEADLATQKSRLDELAAALQEGVNQRTALRAEARRMALDSLSEAETRAAALAQEDIKAETRGRQLTLVAPVAGRVQQLAVHTVGGVVTEAQPLLVVVPQDDVLVVEAHLENKDVGFVRAGQGATVKVETFPYTRYGTLAGTVAHISDDAISDEKRGLVYAVRVRLDEAAIQVDGRKVNLSPGMAVTVDIRTGQRRVIEYFLSPLLQYRDESLRER